MQDVVTGITEHGERLYFTRWAFDAYREGSLDAPRLKAALARCVEFITHDPEDRHEKIEQTC